MNIAIHTIGHSTQSAEKFIGLLKPHAITAVYDVRSRPYSKIAPQFDRERIRHTLANSGIAYVFLGRELGARSELPACYMNGKVQYDRIAATDLFQHGLNCLMAGAMRHRIALMCAEKEPMNCHRSILIARQIVERGTTVIHILEDGSVEEHDAMMTRVMQKLNLPAYDMFQTREELIGDAYRIQGDQIAHRREQAEPTDAFAAEDKP